MAKFVGRVVVTGRPHAVSVAVGMFGRITVQADGREVFAQTPRVTTQEIPFRLLGSAAKLRFGAGTMSSYATCELEVGGQVTRLLKPGESASKPGAPVAKRSHFLGGLASVFVGYSVMMMFREPPVGRRTEFGLFQMAVGCIGLILLAVDWALHRRKE